MSFLKNLQEKAVSTAKIVGNKSQEMVEIGKLKLHITQLENEIKKMKFDMGDLVYDAYSKDTEFPAEEVAKLGGEISAKYTEIEETKAKIQEIQE
ncbi:MAG TPA: hypothetical protein PLL98_09750 [Bacillota bacterium]|nr:hypothetical protein [Bacillota bacterium]HPL53130.1 hypothetical protein [Bacillota bacterium]